MRARLADRHALGQQTFDRQTFGGQTLGRQTLGRQTFGRETFDRQRFCRHTFDRQDIWLTDIWLTDTWLTDTWGQQTFDRLDILLTGISLADRPGQFTDKTCGQQDISPTSRNFFSKRMLTYYDSFVDHTKESIIPSSDILSRIAFRATPRNEWPQEITHPGHSFQ